MGGAKVGGQKYQVNALNGLSDDAPKAQQPMPGASRDSEPSAPSSPKSPAQQNSDRYRAGQVVDGVGVIDGENEMSSAIAAANDQNLLRKYAEAADGKKR